MPNFKMYNEKVRSQKLFLHAHIQKLRQKHFGYWFGLVNIYVIKKKLNLILFTKKSKI